MAMKCWYSWEICSGSLLKKSVHCGERVSQEAGCGYSKIFRRDYSILYLLICPLYHNQKNEEWKKKVEACHFHSLFISHFSLKMHNCKHRNSAYSNIITDTLGTDKNTIALHFTQKKPGHYEGVKYKSHVMIHNSCPSTLFSEK